MSAAAVNILDGANPDNYPQDLNKGYADYINFYNDSETKRYQLAMANRKLSIDAGRGDTLPAKPPVPYKMVLAPPDQYGATYPILSHEPVCAEITEFIPQVPVLSPNHIDVGKRIFGDWFVVGEADTIAAGTTVPGISADGVTGQFMKYGAAVGRGWYLKTG